MNEETTIPASEVATIAFVGEASEAACYAVDRVIGWGVTIEHDGRTYEGFVGERGAHQLADEDEPHVEFYEADMDNVVQIEQIIDTTEPIRIPIYGTRIIVH